MKRSLKNIGWMLVTLIFLGLGKVYGQLVDIPDPNFRKYLQDSIPSVMDTASGKLNQASALFHSGTINCSGLNVKSLEGIQYFRFIRAIDCSNNQITFIPDLSSNPDSLISFKCQNNQLTALPNFAPSANSLKIIYCYNNQISDLPDFTGVDLDSFRCENNRLTFEDLMPILGMISTGAFSYAPQAPVQVNQNAVLNEGDSYLLFFPADTTVPNTTFNLYKNGVLDTVSFSGRVPIFNFNASKAGAYHWQVKNAGLQNLTLYSTTEELFLANKNPEVFTPDGDGINDSFFIPYTACVSKIYDKTGRLIKEIPSPGTWDGTDLQGKMVPIGAYILRCGDNETDITLVY